MLLEDIDIESEQIIGGGGGCSTDVNLGRSWENQQIWIANEQIIRGRACSAGLDPVDSRRFECELTIDGCWNSNILEAIGRHPSCFASVLRYETSTTISKT